MLIHCICVLILWCMVSVCRHFPFYAFFLFYVNVSGLALLDSLHNILQPATIVARNLKKKGPKSFGLIIIIIIVIIIIISSSLSLSSLLLLIIIISILKFFKMFFIFRKPWCHSWRVGSIIFLCFNIFFFLIWMKQWEYSLMPMVTKCKNMNASAVNYTAKTLIGDI